MRRSANAWLARKPSGDVKDEKSEPSVHGTTAVVAAIVRRFDRPFPEVCCTRSWIIWTVGGATGARLLSSVEMPPKL